MTQQFRWLQITLEPGQDLPPGAVPVLTRHIEGEGLECDMLRCLVLQVRTVNTHRNDLHGPWVDIPVVIDA